MNTELKALLALIFGSVKVVEDAVGKLSVTIVLSDILALGESIPAAVVNWGDLPAELSVLYQPANVQDLTTYIQTEFASVIKDPNANAIVVSSVGVLTSIANLVVAIKTAATPVAPVTPSDPVEPDDCLGKKKK